ncbi:MAG: MFS transporter, partial [Parvularculaceae bacterium]|nr:MFS transporter [Parvularculaceae bacterium]
IGGEYGGAVIYVAEHAPKETRGFQTSWIQTTAAFGLLLSLLVIMATRAILPEDAFGAYGWRAPFLLSIFLLGISLWIRMKLNESPVFQKMKEEAATSQAPFREAFAEWRNLKIVLIALFGAVAGQAVTFYTGTFYVLYFLERNLKVDGFFANELVAIALVIGAPLYVFWGWLSDRTGRKPIIMGGLALGALLYFPIFGWLTEAANPALAAAQKSAPVVVTADPARCSFQFDPVGRTKFDARSCDVAKSFLARAGVAYASVDAPAGAPTVVTIGTRSIAVPETAALAGDARSEAIKAFHAEAKDALASVGYPEKADSASVNGVAVVALIVLLMNITAMCYGPMAALLVELFPARIRYTAISLPYHIGNGWFGGFLPTTAFAIVAATGSTLAGLWYPVVIAGATLVIGVLFLPETRDRRIEHYYG